VRAALIAVCLTIAALPSSTLAAPAQPGEPTVTTSSRDRFGIGARVGLGGVVRSEGVDGEGVLPMVAAELDLRFYDDGWFGDIALGLMFNPDDDRYGALTLSGTGNLYLSEAAMAPYVGAGVGLRMDSAPETSELAMGVGAHVGAGLVLDRDAATRWFADLRLGAHFVSPSANAFTGRTPPSYVRFELLAGVGASF